jgi:hypothetical protein
MLSPHTICHAMNIKITSREYPYLHIIVDDEKQYIGRGTDGRMEG